MATVDIAHNDTKVGAERFIDTVFLLLIYSLSDVLMQPSIRNIYSPNRNNHETISKSTVISFLHSCLVHRIGSSNTFVLIEHFSILKNSQNTSEARTYSMQFLFHPKGSLTFRKILFFCAQIVRDHNAN